MRYGGDVMRGFVRLIDAKEAHRTASTIIETTNCSGRCLKREAMAEGLQLEAEQRAALERVHREWQLQSILKFRLFFAGLVFAILAFSIQVPIKTAPPPSVGWTLQVAAWASLLISGMLALRDAGGFVSALTEAAITGLQRRGRAAMYVLFSLGMMCLAAARISAGS
jgi:hypothetical protein